MMVGGHGRGRRQEWAQEENKVSDKIVPACPRPFHHPAKTLELTLAVRRLSVLVCSGAELIKMAFRGHFA